MNSRICLLIVFSVFFGNVASAALSDKIAMVIGDRVITQTEYDKKRDLFIKLNQVRLNNKQQELQFNKDFNKALIEQELQLLAGSMMNIVLDKGDVSRLQKELFVKYQVTSTAELKQQVMESGVHYDALIEHAQESVLVQKIQSLVLRNRFQVGESEINRLRDKLIKENTLLYVEDIYYNTEKANDAKKALLLEKSHQVSGFWKKGTYQASTVPKKSKMITFRWKKLSDFPDQFKATLKNMKDSDVSETITTDNGYHVLKLVKSKLPKGFQASKEHLSQQLFVNKMVAELPVWIAELKEQFYVSNQLD